MGQWGRPAHKGIRHNQRVRGGGTWSAQDRRLKWHMRLRWWRKRGAAETWSSQDRKLNRRPGWQLDWIVARIVLAGLVVTVISIGGQAIVIAVIVVIAVAAWRKIRSLRRLPGRLA